ncbi:hypothetical protein [Actinoplanes siamensis]|uniref:Uncharacterized protein n=1 Tax=Actinoplanes siamensis TaxID=1223317 RepID=A0A919NCJ2_9ACTN|nr:hypothetical protein [Actinoplanes siamensis]GIF08712.1 hypothetical protein Asi03nite_62500 [Actinoplanes siamensis]
MADLTLDQALAELPDTADGIAAYLIEQECRGKPRRTDCCPIANYLRGTGEFSDIDVDPEMVTVWDDDDRWEQGRQQEIQTPEHVASFIRRFDGGAWPELVAEGGDDRA